ncbi:hypothetical protein T05_9552 [Trichinella murrelli]|uniref:Uncharacterized protein n=1 Tax=Trichinella murrelli TaxID=144512 RepID=A0A0V0U1I7_9BILA|nr:hypothetical protein T05_9552 [Trichinella murrelli]
MAVHELCKYATRKWWKRHRFQRPVPLAISRLKFGHTLGQLIPNLPASNARTANRTVRLACEATGELNFKVFISRLIPRDFAVKWHATEIWKTLSTLSSTSSSSHRPNGQSPNSNCRIQYACFWSSSAKNKKIFQEKFGTFTSNNADNEKSNDAAKCRLSKTK